MSDAQIKEAIRMVLRCGGFIQYKRNIRTGAVRLMDIVTAEQEAEGELGEPNCQTLRGLEGITSRVEKFGSEGFEFGRGVVRDQIQEVLDKQDPHFNETKGYTPAYPATPC